MPYLVDSRAQVPMTHKSLNTKGHLTGTIKRVPIGIWKGLVWLLGYYDLITPRDMKELQKKLLRHERPRHAAKTNKAWRLYNLFYIELEDTGDWQQQPRH